MTKQMTAAVLYGKEHLRIETVDVPKIGPGDALVRVRAALTCGTDVKVFRRGYHARMIQPPALFGHELAGDVVAMGPAPNQYAELQAGRPRSWPPIQPLAANAIFASAARKTFARTCYLTTGLTRNTFASRSESYGRTCTTFRNT